MKPKLLDLFCGAGGAGEGYRRAGFDVTGIDIKPQKNNPHKFIQTDALDYVEQYGHQYDVIHASPPCQRFSPASNLSNVKNDYPDLISTTRSLLIATGKPYVIENVPRAPLFSPLRLSGMMFDLDVIRERWFECNPSIYFSPIPKRKYRSTIKLGQFPDVGNQYHCVVGNFKNLDYARQAMGIDWMTRDELAQAIPPVYTEYIGRWIMNLVFDRPISPLNLKEMVS